MFVESIHLKSIRSIDTLVWRVGAGPAAGWHVILGDNGAGKSTVLRCVALALAGETEALALRQNWDTWLRRGTDHGEMTVMVRPDSIYDKFVKGGKTPKNYALPLALSLRRDGGVVSLKRITTSPDPTRHVWGSGAGWFSASYGPFRRFSGGDKDQEKLFYSNPRLARHLSVFGESIALSEAVEWLKMLQFRALEQHPTEKDFIGVLRDFVNQPDFLPHGAKLERVSSEGVRFVDGNGYELPVDSLSDGYRSVLSMTFELIRQLAATFGVEGLFSPDRTQILPSGVVLIDEVDAHLHPTWQRRIGPWFRKHFPNIQFIVTTHSPLVCQSASEGTVFELARPGSGEQGRMVTGAELDRLVYGDILDAYGTGLFGDGVTRSQASIEKLARLAELNVRAIEDTLTDVETLEQSTLRNILPTAGTSES